jgi:hypothetical protein
VKLPPIQRKVEVRIEEKKPQIKLDDKTHVVIDINTGSPPLKKKQPWNKKWSLKEMF